jgi:hypothetical protein
VSYKYYYWDDNIIKGLVHPIYNPSFLTFFSVRILFFSHNKSANGVFQPAYQHSRTRQGLHYRWMDQIRGCAQYAEMHYSERAKKLNAAVFVRGRFTSIACAALLNKHDAGMVPACRTN